MTRAVFANSRLWVLSDAGQISSITEGQDMRVEESLPEPALDLCLQDGHPAVITCQRESCKNWTLRRWVTGKWSVEASVKTERDDLVALSCIAGKVTLLTNRRLIDISSHTQSAVVLSEKLPAGMVASVHGTPNQVFVGTNAGEWGGGLRRIDRRNGKVAMIEGHASGGSSPAPINASLDRFSMSCCTSISMSTSAAC